MNARGTSGRGRAAVAPARRGRRLLAPVMSALVAAALAFGFVVYALWPRWPATAPAAGAPHLPILIAGETFHVPPAAIRVAVQRHSGPQDRVDLVYAWPALVPAARAADGGRGAALPERSMRSEDGGKAAALPPDRLFVSIAGNDGQAEPGERLRTIYLRYAQNDRSLAPHGLAVLAFRDGTPYQGEDLAFDEAAPDRFLARCSRVNGALAPATCLAERVAGQAAVTIRFPREWLADWRALAAGIDRLIAELRPRGGG